MTLRDLYFRNDNINLFDRVYLNIEGQIIKGRLYQFNKYFNFHVDSVGGLSGNIYYLSEGERGYTSFKEFLLLYGNGYFLNNEIDVYCNGTFINTVPVLDAIHCEFCKREDYSFHGNTVFFDENLLRF